MLLSPIVDPAAPARGAHMSRNSLYLLIGVLAVIVVAFGIWYFYQQSQKPSLEIKLDGQGITVK